MKFQFLMFSLTGLLLSLASPSFADNIADCEIVLLQVVEDESGRGGTQVASYGPADAFLNSVYDTEIDVIKDVGGVPIQAVMCKRMDVVPTHYDFKILKTGVPLFLSQSFDSQNSDLISLFFKEGEFRHTYTGPGLTDETKELIEARLVDFNAKKHDLAQKEGDLKVKREAEKVERETIKAEKTEHNDTEIMAALEGQDVEEEILADTTTEPSLMSDKNLVSDKDLSFESSTEENMTTLEEEAESE